MLWLTGTLKGPWAGEALARRPTIGTRLSLFPLELPGLTKEPSGPLVGVDAPLFGPGVGLKAMGRIRALP